MPIMDGSAQPFVKVLQEAGIKDFKIPKNYYIITEPVKYVNKEKGIPHVGLPPCAGQLPWSSPY